MQHFVLSSATPRLIIRHLSDPFIDTRQHQLYHDRSTALERPIRLACQADRNSAPNRLQRLAVMEAGSAKAAPQKHVWALDFDGVVCDSVGESALSAWKAALKKWPEVFGTLEAKAKKDSVVEDMRLVRPVVETGYENLVQVRCLLEGVSPQDILADWHNLLPEYMAKWDLDRTELVELFGGTRDAWIHEDLQGWLAPNRIYPGVPAVLNELIEHHELYIVTTKQERFTDALLRDKAKVTLPLDRIFSQTVSGAPKSEVLQMLEDRHPGSTYHFVEDKMGTLEKVCKIKDLDAWQLYLVDWGYNTEEERKRANKNPRIKLLTLDTFSDATN